MHRLRGFTNLFQHPTGSHLVLIAAIVLVGIAGVLVAGRLSPTSFIAVGTGAEIFSGNWKTMGVSLPLDRALLLVGLLSMVFGGRRLLADRSLVLRPVHLLILGTAAWATCSSIWATTIGSHNGFYALLDRLGLIPFLAFVLAPLLFGTPAKRRIVLGVLVAVGAYLGFTAVMEGIGLTHLVFPRYIANPAVGISYGRARGPLLDGAGNGIALIMGGAAAAVGIATWHRFAARVACAAVVVMCGLGVLFTLTRAVWIGAALGAIVGLLAAERTRKYVPHLVVAAVLSVLLALAVVPGLHSKVTTRAETSSSVWDRLNTDRAALEAAVRYPAFGLGWQTFETKGPTYLRQAGTYPQTGAGLEVHNVFLSHAVELGLPGSILWTLALFGAVGGAIWRRGPPDLEPWRPALLAIFVAFLVVANFGPLSYAFPNLVLWMMAGVMSVDYLSIPRLDMSDAIDDLDRLSLMAQDVTV